MHSGQASQGPIGRAAQIVVIAIYVLVTAVHATLLTWLFLIPRHRRERLAQALIRPTWGWYSNLLMGMRVTVVGRENLPISGRGFLVVGNHESFLDILLLAREVGGAFLMKRSVLVSPVGWGGYLMGSIGFDRGDANARRRALLRCLEMAERSSSVIVFPEGTFGHEDGRLRKPHLNLLRHAFDRGIAVIPLGHAGTRRGLDGQSLPLRRGTQVALVVRPPLTPRDFVDRDAFATACWDHVTAAVGEARRAVPSGWPYLEELPAESDHPRKST